MLSIQTCHPLCPTRTSLKLGERILVQKRRDCDVAEDICNELRDKYVVEINDQNKE
jgi:hypothetical protein